MNDDDITNLKLISFVLILLSIGVVVMLVRLIGLNCALTAYTLGY